jgi:hypothetical protein
MLNKVEHLTICDFTTIPTNILRLPQASRFNWKSQTTAIGIKAMRAKARENRFDNS